MRARTVCSIGRTGLYAALWLTLSAVVGFCQTPGKSKNIFDDAPQPDPSPRGGGAVPAIPAPAPGLVQGALVTTYGAVVPGPAVPTRASVVPRLSFEFTHPAATGFIPMSFHIAATLHFPPGFRGTFYCQTTGEYDITLDGKIVSSFVAGDPSRCFQQEISVTGGLHTLTSNVSHLHSDGNRQKVWLMGKPISGVEGVIPDEMCWHSRADEPPGLQTVPLTPAAAGANRPAAPAAQPPYPPQPTAQTSPPAPRAQRLPIPDADAQARTAALLRQRYPQGWVDADSAQQADFLIKASEQNASDAVGSYVLLQRAYQQAQSAAALPVAFQAIDLLAAQFNVDPLRLKLAVLERQGAKRSANATAVAAVITIFEKAMAEGNYPVASDAAAMSLADARARGAAAEAGERVRRAGTALVELEKIKPLLARLKENPGDAQASLAVGKFYCFIAGQWPRGAALLAGTNDPVFSWLGRREASAAAQGPAAQTALANGWWDAADGQSDNVAQIMRKRAAQWYAAAAPNLAGLSLRVAQKRSAKFILAGLPSPLTEAPVSPVASAAPAGSSADPSAPPVSAPPRAPDSAAPAPTLTPSALVIVVDRADLRPNRIATLAGLIRRDVKAMDPAAQVTIIISDSPPTVITCRAGDFETQPGMADRFETAMRAAVANPGGDLPGALTLALSNPPPHLNLYLDGNAPVDRLIAILHEKDPRGRVSRFAHIAFPDDTSEHTKAERMMRGLGCDHGASTHDI